MELCQPRQSVTDSDTRLYATGVTPEFGSGGGLGRLRSTAAPRLRVAVNEVSTDDWQTDMRRRPGGRHKAFAEIAFGWILSNANATDQRVIAPLNGLVC